MDWGRWLQHHETIKNLLSDFLPDGKEQNQENQKEPLVEQGLKEIYFERAFLLAWLMLLTIPLRIHPLTCIVEGLFLFYVVKFIYAWIRGY